MPEANGATAESKALDKERKAVEKIMNDADDMFCGFVKLQILDQDAYARQVKGAEIAGPVHLVKKEGGKVFLQATFAPNPLFYLMLEREPNNFLSGEMWYGDAKRSPLNLIGKIVPKSCEQIVSTMDKTKSSESTLKVELPFLANAPERLAPLSVVTREEKFITKVASVTLELGEAEWKEWKEYRVRFWKQTKAWGASPGDGGDEDDKKKDEKKE
mmetsp:Transcript_4915/g.12246  ORF Transcript_4915/g.12246 Transcript_4915/m.12246 type:complete len:215 (+) Transcript_4915:233-877(+)|eukprot:CAMPEP_0179005152 /NCGR_PEP_ID=MMETSP0795-20121207/13745_1 /TAXON_ID=88552 /ORGANISM="Amoebophrya sp., Strain Ameob2" /LENGTH=214 /DNA_ID=CAMNT_0020699581 /DNA_START=144 /DNA_END=788 /DNA_ORIENTATION=-